MRSASRSRSCEYASAASIRRLKKRSALRPARRAISCSTSAGPLRRRRRGLAGARAALLRVGFGSAGFRARADDAQRGPFALVRRGDAGASSGRRLRGASSPSSLWYGPNAVRRVCPDVRDHGSTGRIDSGSDHARRRCGRSRTSWGIRRRDAPPALRAPVDVRVRCCVGRLPWSSRVCWGVSAYRPRRPAPRGHAADRRPAPPERSVRPEGRRAR